MYWVTLPTAALVFISGEGVCFVLDCALDADGCDTAIERPRAAPAVASSKNSSAPANVTIASRRSIAVQVEQDTPLPTVCVRNDVA